MEGAWQALSAEAATLSESQQRMADENATLVASLDETRQQLEQAQLEQADIGQHGGRVGTRAGCQAASRSQSGGCDCRKRAATGGAGT